MKKVHVYIGVGILLLIVLVSITYLTTSVAVSKVLAVHAASISSAPISSGSSSVSDKEYLRERALRGIGDFTHNIATPGSMVLPSFTSNKEPKLSIR